jgi:cytochrome c
MWRNALAVLLTATVAPSAHAADGPSLFDQQCSACHSLGGASSPEGPSLRAIVGRRVASLADFTYTASLRDIGGSWTPRRLDEFLKNSQALAPGTSMYFALDDDADRRALVDYLKTAR